MVEFSDDIIIKSAVDALHIEAQALEQAAQKLDERFVVAVRKMAGCSGRVVVTGLGKSGHIGRKIAATLSSTGTSAIFLHPSEALHGDMGIIQPQDVLLAIAYRGETIEVNEVVKYARRLGITIVSITGNQDSSLAELSDIVLDGSVTREACPLNLAPTASSTLALSLGDALAVALMTVKGISQNEFAQYHPAGSLGKKLSKVKDLMIPLDRLARINPHSPIHDIMKAITSNNNGVAAVVDNDNHLLGCITDGDLRRAFIRYEGSVFEKNAELLMSKNPVWVVEDELTLKAVSIMEGKKITAIFVVNKDSKRITGLLKMHDILAAKII